VTRPPRYTPTRGLTRTTLITGTLLLAGALLLALAATAAAQSETVWVQPPGEPGLAPSQFSTDAPIYAEVADDFIPEHDYDINEISWWGRFDSGDARVKDSGQPSVGANRRGGTRYLDCTDPILLPCGSVVSDHNSSGNDDVDNYDCAGTWHETGPEMLYELPIPGPGVGLTLTLSDMTADLDLFLLWACHADSCLISGENGISITLDDAGTYYVIVDGYHGAESPYTLTVDCQGTADRVFVVRVYLANPLSGLPVDLVGERYIMDFTETPGPQGLTEYHATFDPIEVDAGTRYCVSVQMVGQSLTEGEWFWAQAEGAVQEPNDYPWIEDARLSADRWTSFKNLAGFPGDWDYDMAFELGGVETPVEKRNWGTIKALYR